MTDAGQRTVIEVVLEDHREVEELFAHAERISQPAAYQEIVSQTIAELVRHFVAEEQYLYPAIRAHVVGGAEMADHELAEHAAAERMMKRIERLDASDPRLRQEFEKLVGEVTHHLRAEERDALPRLKAACSDERLRELGRQVERAKSYSPTRPHPSAPDTPPMNRILAPGAGLVDRVRDLVTGRQV